jgi:uncharacterized membrane-anchored protein
VVELDLRHGLDHVLAFIVDRMDQERREEFDTWLWSDPVREARIRAALGR